jgi:hypothetical protein
MEKPKTSTVDKMSEIDLNLLNRLLNLCGTYYERISNPIKNNPHSNPAELDNLKQQILLMSLKVGERIWYPRGNPGSTTSLNAPKVKKRNER